MQGVLRSWAVPKGPPTKLREARLAMHVEDHPLDYADFEGTIPPGNYGAGTVMVWDQGEYEDLTGNPAAAFHQGKMHVIMRGKKLKGEWILVKDRREEDSNKWLLIKAGKPHDALGKSGRHLGDQRALDEADREGQRRAVAEQHARGEARQTRPVEPPHREAPAFVEPMQCKAVTELPEGDDWTFEIKFDGYRCIAVKSGSKVTLFSRNEKKLNDRFPALAEALAELPGDFAVDGEIVALDEQGPPVLSTPAKQRVRNARRSSSTPSIC